MNIEVPTKYPLSQNRLVVFEIRLQSKSPIFYRPALHGKWNALSLARRALKDKFPTPKVSLKTVLQNRQVFLPDPVYRSAWSFKGSHQFLNKLNFHPERTRTIYYGLINSESQIIILHQHACLHIRRYRFCTRTTFPIAIAHSLVKPADCLLNDPGRSTHTLKHTHIHIHVCATKPCLACNNSALGPNSDSTCTKIWQQKKDSILILKLD